MRLEQTIETIDKWVAERVVAGYTEKAAAAVRGAVAGSISEELHDEDQANLIAIFSKDTIVDEFQHYFAQRYVVSIGILDEIEKSDAEPQGAERVVMQNVARAAINIVEFVNGLAEQEECNPEAIEKAFVETYASVQAFSADYLTMIELVLYGIMRQSNKSEAYDKVDGTFLAMPKAVQVALDEITRYNELHTRETLRAEREFMPLIFDKAVGDLYKARIGGNKYE